MGDFARAQFNWVGTDHGGLTGLRRLRHDADSPSIWYPRQESNLGTWFRKPLLYPLSYGGRRKQCNLNLDRAEYRP